MPDRGRRRARQRRRRVLLVGVVAAAGAGIGLGVSTANAQGSVAYRTAVVSTSAVDHTLDVSGTLEPVSQAAAEFQVSGTVATVDVTNGQKVSAGQTIATLDTTSLQAALTEAQDTLDSAQAKLTEDELDESSSSSATSAGSSSQTGQVQAATASTVSVASYVLTATSGPTGTVPTGSGSTSNGGSITQDQQAVVADQHDVDTAMQSAAADLTVMQTACAGTATAPTEPTTSTTAPSTTSTTSVTSAAVPSAGTTVASVTGSSSAACATALTAASAAEQQVATDQKTLATDETTLAGALTAEATSSSATTNTSTGTGSSSQSTGGASSARTSGSGSTTATGSSKSATVDTDTPEQVAGDEATIDNDQAGVVEAQQSLAAATLVSPVSGTVESVGVVAGGNASASSSSNAITIIDWNSYEVSATLTTAEVENVKVGQDAQATVAGTSGTLDAKVTRVGPVDESDSSYTYPVILTVTSPTGQIAAGSAAQTVIDLSHAAHALVVPTSAVHTTSTGSYVYLDRNGSEFRQAVKTGLLGDIYTQITSGLAIGQVVILADPSQAVPSSSSNTTNSSSRSGTAPFGTETFTGGTGSPGGGGTPPGPGSSGG